jgi:hypothetical protein
MEKKYTKLKKDHRVLRITYLILCILLVACSPGEVAENASVTIITSPEITFDYEKGLGSNPSNFVSNWNKLVNQVSKNEQTVFFFSINPARLTWVNWKNETLVYQFGNEEGIISAFTLNLNVDPTNDNVYGIEFFAPASQESIIAEQTKFFFLLLIAISDPELNKEGRETVLSNLGLYENVMSPELMSGSLTKNDITYQLEPLVENNLLIGISFFIVDNNFSTPG